MNLTTLEQSNKLKKWGAPQDTAYYYDLGDGGQLNNNFYTILPEHFTAAYDLESLIGWLGDDFSRLIWHMKHQKYKAQGARVGETYPLFEGRTPLEAVYDLAEAAHGKETGSPFEDGKESNLETI